MIRFLPRSDSVSCDFCFLLVKVQVPCLRENFSKVMVASIVVVEMVHCRVVDLLSPRQVTLNLLLCNESCNFDVWLVLVCELLHPNPVFDDFL